MTLDNTAVSIALAKATGYNFTFDGSNYSTAAINKTSAQAVMQQLASKTGINLTFSENEDANARLAPRDQRATLSCSAEEMTADKLSALVENMHEISSGITHAVADATTAFQR